MAKNEKTAAVHNALLCGERAASETYQQALAKIGEEPGVVELRQIHRDHREAFKILCQHVLQEGGTPDQNSGSWGTWAKIVESAAQLFSNVVALKALKEGEEHGVKSYENALQDEALPAECKVWIRSTLLPQTLAHIPILDRLMSGK